MEIGRNWILTTNSREMITYYLRWSDYSEIQVQGLTHCVLTTFDESGREACLPLTQVVNECRVGARELDGSG